MNKKNLVFAISILLLTSTFMTSFAYAQTSKGLPFDELWKILTQIQQKLVITQTNNQDTILQLKMAENPSNPPFVITNADNENIFTVFPDGTVKLGAHSVVIDPNTGASQGLRVGAENIPDNTIQSNHIGSNQIKGTHIGNKEIGKDHINDKAVGREKIEDKAVGHDQIDDKAIGKDKINDKAVGREKIEDKAVGHDQIDNAAIGSDQLAEGSVTSFHILDGTITGTDIGSNLDISNLSVAGILKTTHSNQIKTITGIPNGVNTLLHGGDGMRVGTDTAFVIFSNPSQFEALDCIESKPSGYAIILQFASDTMIGFRGCPTGTSTISMMSHNEMNAGDILVLISDGGSWRELVINPEIVVELPEGYPVVLTGLPIDIGSTNTLLVIGGLPFTSFCPTGSPEGTVIALGFATDVNALTMCGDIINQDFTTHDILVLQQMNPDSLHPDWKELGRISD